MRIYILKSKLNGDIKEFEPTSPSLPEPDD